MRAGQGLGSGPVMAGGELSAHTTTTGTQRHRVIRLAAFGTAAAAVLYLLVYVSTTTVPAPPGGGVRGVAPSVPPSSHSSAATPTATATTGGHAQPASRVDRGSGGGATGSSVTGDGSGSSDHASGSGGTGHSTGGQSAGASSSASSSASPSSSSSTSTSQSTPPVVAPPGSGLGMGSGHDGAAASDSGATPTSTADEATRAAAAGEATATAGSSSSTSHLPAASTPLLPPLCTSNPDGGEWVCESQVVARGGVTASAPTSECFLYGDHAVWHPSGCRLAPPLQHRSRAQEACDVLGRRFASITFVGDSVVLGMFKAMAGLANTRGHTTQCWNHNAAVDVDATSLFPCHRGTGIVSAPQCHTPPSDLSCCTKDKPLESRCLQDLFFTGRGCEKHFGTYDTFGDHRVCGGKLKMAGFLVYMYVRCVCAAAVYGCVCAAAAVAVVVAVAVWLFVAVCLFHGGGLTVVYLCCPTS